MILTIVCVLLFMVTGFVENITASKVHSKVAQLHGNVDFELIKDAIKHGNHLTKDIEEQDFKSLKRLKLIKVILFIVFLISFWV